MAQDAGKLIITFNGREIKRVSLTGESLTIGRAASNGLELAHPQVSLRHAELRIGPQGPLIVDLGSDKGTFAGDQRLLPQQPALLTDGASFRIGPFVLTYDAPPAPPEPVAPAPEPVVVVPEPVPPAPVTTATPPAPPPPIASPEPQPEPLIPFEAVPSAALPASPTAPDPLVSFDAPPPVVPAGNGQGEQVAAQEPVALPPVPEPMLVIRPPDPPIAPPPVVPPPPTGNGNGRALLAPPPAPLRRPHREWNHGQISRYLYDLPILYQDVDRDDAHGNFLGRFLLIFEAIWEPLEQRQDHIPMYFDPRTCPEAFLPWMAGWLGLSFSEKLSNERRRLLLREAMELYRWRGTRYGLSRMIEICTGLTAMIQEHEPFVFQIKVYHPADEHVDQSLVEDLIRAHKPAHVGYVLSFEAE